MSEFRDAVAAAAHDTPYTVVDIKKGFAVRLDVANAKWWGLYNRAGLRKTFRWRVAERESYFTVTDRQVELRWSASVPALGATIQGQSGRILTLSREKIWALSDRGRIEPVVNYKFNSREGRDLIRVVARQQGLKERLPLMLKFTIAVTAATPAVFAVWGWWRSSPNCSVSTSRSAHPQTASWASVADRAPSPRPRHQGSWPR